MLRRKRRKNLQNFWPLLALPIIGAAGWAARRFLGRNKPSRAIIPISGEEAANKTSKTVTDTGPSAIEREVVEKNAEKEPKIEFATGSDAKPQSIETRPARTNLPPTAGHALKNRPGSTIPFFVLLVPFLVIPVVIVMLAFSHIPVQNQQEVPNGDARQGQALLAAWGCGACHTIPGIPGANGVVGPNLGHISDRSYIAGRLPNNPDNLVQWIMHPQEIAPGVDMPDSNVPEGVARNIAAYLYSLR